MTPASVHVVSQPEDVTSVRQAAAVCNVSPTVVRRWRSLGLIPEPPWTLEQLHRFVTSPILMVDAAAIVRHTARWQGGTQDVVAADAANSKVTPPGTQAAQSARAASRRRTEATPGRHLSAPPRHVRLAVITVT